MKAELEIRPFQSTDAQQIEQLFKASVEQLARRFYSEAQIKAWAARGPKAESVKLRNQDGRRTLVCSNLDQEVLAYAELETDGHIDQVYARPDAAGKEIVSRLYDELESIARDMGLKTLYTEASEGARRFFLKKNFIDHGRQDFEIEGVKIHNYKMDKSL